jgi:hypothetical protein
MDVPEPRTVIFRGAGGILKYQIRPRHADRKPY